MKFLIFLTLFSISVLSPQQQKPTLYLIGDSTVRNPKPPQAGWGEMIAAHFDTAAINISNQAMAGRSTRTFVKEKRWEKVLAALKPGDFVMMQFGHNEGSKPDTSRSGYRGVLRGTGDETVDLTWKDGSIETVHTYGWYLKKFVQEAKAKGATPIICSMIPRNQFVNGKVKRANNDFGKWAKEVANANDAFFIDLNSLTADKYDALGPDAVKQYFPGDHTHTNSAGASVNAASVAAGIRQLGDLALNRYLIK